MRARVFPSGLLAAGLEKLLAEKGIEIADDPDVVLVTSLDWTAEARSRHPEVKLVVLVGDPLPMADLMGVYQVERISAVCVSDRDLDVLVLILSLAHAGQVMMPPGLLEFIAGNAQVANGIEIVPTVAGLSEREMQVLKLLRTGDSNKVIARKLGAAEATVKVHVKAVLRKLRLKNRTQAAMWTEIRVGV